MYYVYRCAGIEEPCKPRAYHNLRPKNLDACTRFCLASFKKIYFWVCLREFFFRCPCTASFCLLKCHSFLDLTYLLVMFDESTYVINTYLLFTSLLWGIKLIPQIRLIIMTLDQFFILHIQIDTKVTIY